MSGTVALPPALLEGTTQARSLLLLLVAGHLLADFAFQTRRMASGKDRPRVLLHHVLVVVLAHLVALLPFLGLGVVAAAAGIGASHGVIDLLKSRWPWERPGRLGLFVLDQALHGAVLLAAFLLLSAAPGGLPLRTSAAWLHGWTVAAVVAGAFAFNWTGAGAVVSAILAALSPGLEEEEEESSGVKGSGRLIGQLERAITLVLILLGQWAAIVLLLAAKSIARFEELKQRRFAEYYLVGTLSSLLVAILVGLALGVVLYGGIP